MEMDYNLKKIALPVYFGEIVKKSFIVCSSLKETVNMFLSVLYEQFYIR